MSEDIDFVAPKKRKKTPPAQATYTNISKRNVFTIHGRVAPGDTIRLYPHEKQEGLKRS